MKYSKLKVTSIFSMDYTVWHHEKKKRRNIKSSKDYNYIVGCSCRHILITVQLSSVCFSHN